MGCRASAERLKLQRIAHGLLMGAGLFGRYFLPKRFVGYIEECVSAGGNKKRKLQWEGTDHNHMTRWSRQALQYWSSSWVMSFLQSLKQRKLQSLARALLMGAVSFLLFGKSDKLSSLRNYVALRELGGEKK